MKKVNIFEKASRSPLRFICENPDINGNLMVEDLWDLKLSDLDVMAQKLNTELKSAEEKSFLKKKSRENVKLKLKFDILIHIIETKQEEIEKKEDALDRKSQKEKLEAVRERKVDSDLEGLSIEEIDKKIAEL